MIRCFCFSLKDDQLLKFIHLKLLFSNFQRENSLRKHNFVQFIYNIIRILAERGELQARVEYARKEMSKRIKDRAEKKKGESSSKN